MSRRNLDTSGTGKKALLHTQTMIHDFGHLFQPVDPDVDNGIDGYIRVRKKIKYKKIIKNKSVSVEDYVDTGKLIGVQVKGVTSRPTSRSNGYYIILKDKDKFGVNFGKKETLDKHKIVWKNFIGPVILIFVDLTSKESWWADLEDSTSYDDNDYGVTVSKINIFNESAFKKIKRLGKEIFAKSDIPIIDAKNSHFVNITLSNFKESAKKAYINLSEKGDFFTPTINPLLGEIIYSRSGWKHITRLNRRKMRIFNSMLLLGISKSICEKVTKFSFVKKGTVRESHRYIKKIEFLTLRANVNFNYRQTTIVQVVLRRIKCFDKIHTDRKIEDRIFFHSVYEPYRKE